MELTYVASSATFVGSVLYRCSYNFLKVVTTAVVCSAVLLNSDLLLFLLLRLPEERPKRISPVRPHLASNLKRKKAKKLIVKNSLATNKSKLTNKINTKRVKSPSLRASTKTYLHK